MTLRLSVPAIVLGTWTVQGCSDDDTSSGDVPLADDGAEDAFDDEGGTAEDVGPDFDGAGADGDADADSDADGDGDADVPPAPPFRVHFYGNRGTWGSLGLDDTGTMWPNVDAVVARYASLCDQARLDSGYPDLECGADLIGYAPGNYMEVTEEVASRLIAEYGAKLTIDIRPEVDMTFAEVRGIVTNIFGGTSGIVSTDFLRAHPLGLSLDYEPLVTDGSYSSVPASEANAACNEHRRLMTALGHDPAGLWCFLYEYGNPPLVADGENLEPYIFPMLMSGTVIGLLPGPTEAERTAQALALKESWIDRLAAEYVHTDFMGCMLFTVPYLHDTQRDHFSFAQAIPAFGDKCDVFSFQ